MPLTHDELVQLNCDNVLFAWSKQGAVNPVALDRAQGVHIWDANGKRYFDFSSQLMCSNLGHGHPRVVAAIQEQVGKFQFFHPGYAHEPKGRLAEELLSITPGDMGKVFFTLGGAEANENAIKISRMATGRHKVLSRYRSYHGATAGAATLSGDPRRFAAEPGIPGVVHFYGPYTYRSPFGASNDAEECERALHHLEQTIQFEGPETIAALFLEGTSGSSGLLLYPEGYMRGVRTICDRHGILLVIDEVMSGFGRTGEWFGYSHFDIDADIVTMAKGLTSAYLPLGAVVISEKLASHFDDNALVCGLTYSGHPVSCAAGLAVIETFHEEGILERVRALAPVQDRLLAEMKERHPSVGDVRNVGLFGVIECVRNRLTREPMTPWNAKPDQMEATLKLTSALRERGLMTFVRWSWLFCVPPLVITKAELEEAYGIIDEALSVADEYVTE
jgi:taurine--2-oxoglutarate transaminase